jgi:AraC-like DNA-binding protein
VQGTTRANAILPASSFYREYRVPPAIDQSVEALWTAESAAGPFPDRQIVVPDGTANWIFNLGEPYSLHLDGGSRICDNGCGVIVGTRSRSCLMEIKGRLSLVGVRFRPGGLHGFVAHDASELTDQFAPSEALFGSAGHSLECRLFDMQLPEDRVRLIEQTLLGLRRDQDGNRPIQRAVEALLRHRGMGSIADLADERGLGYKQLERGFQRLVGMTPKRFARTIRLLFVSHEALHQGATWAAIAASCGFWDQAHLIDEMKQIFGATPTLFRGKRGVLASVLSSGERLSNFLKVSPNSRL